MKRECEYLPTCSRRFCGCHGEAASFHRCKKAVHKAEKLDGGAEKLDGGEPYFREHIYPKLKEAEEAVDPRSCDNQPQYLPPNPEIFDKLGLPFKPAKNATDDSVAGYWVQYPSGEFLFVPANDF